MSRKQGEPRNERATQAIVPMSMPGPRSLEQVYIERQRSSERHVQPVR